MAIQLEVAGHVGRGGDALAGAADVRRMGSHGASRWFATGSSGAAPLDVLIAQHLARDQRTWPLDVMPMTARPVTIAAVSAGRLLSGRLEISTATPTPVNAREGDRAETNQQDAHHPEFMHAAPSRRVTSRARWPGSRSC